MNTTTEQLSQKKKCINWKRAEGMKFGRWTVKSWIESTPSKGNLMRCECECGAEKIVAAHYLARGESRSCGCLRNEKTAERSKRHGLSKRGDIKRHFTIYHDMLKRCHSPSRGHPRYQGRGIQVCDRWRFGEGGVNGLTLFVLDMGEPPTIKHTLERQDNEKGYSPDNCVWGTRFDQSNNRCDTRLITYKGETLSLSRWAAKTGLPRTTLSMRFNSGWSEERMIETPLRGKGGGL